MPLDLSSMKDNRTFVDDFAAKQHPPIVALLLNAGLQITAGISYTADGIEKTFGINHVGHALLLYLLRPYMADTCRIIITASGTHDPAQKTGVPDAVHHNAEELAHSTSEQVRNYNGRQKYSTSKLCNVMWMYALQRRLVKEQPVPDSQKWTVSAFDPGLMPGTGLARDASPILRFLWINILPRVIPLLRRLTSPNIHTTHESGLALASLGVGAETGDVADGKYSEGMKEIKSSVASYDDTKQDDLWSWTIKAVAKDEEEMRAFEKVYLS